MRYVVLVLFAIVSTILSGSVFSGLNLAGIQVDIVLLIVLALALVDKSGAAIIFAAGTGLFMDIMYSTVLGVYALSYTVAAAIVFLAFRNKEKFNVLILFLVGAAGYVIKETVMALIVYVLGARFDFLSILVRYTPVSYTHLAAAQQSINEQADNAAYYKYCKFDKEKR